jgi:N-acetylglucosamine-6-phosphate deacetylase
MPIKLLKNCTIYTGESVLNDHSILIKDGMVHRIIPSGTKAEANEIIDLGGRFVVPGFIDLQLNGGGGVFLTQDTSEKTIDKIYEVYLESGTTGFLPTIISSSLEKILEAIEVTRTFMRKKKDIVLGLHVEGPYFNVKKRGAHPEKIIRKPSDEEIQTIAKNGKGVVSLLSAAPEMLSAKQIKILLDAGIRLSAAHTEVSYPEAMQALNGGFIKVTHLFNGMSQFMSRNPGLVGAYLDHPNAWAGIIVDGIHVDYASVRLAHKLKKGRLFVVSDSSYVGHPPEIKNFDFGFGKIRNQNGSFYTENGSLAGAAVTMLKSLQNCVRHVGIDLDEAAKMVSTYPAQFLEIDGHFGKIKEGYVANLVVLNNDLELEKVFTRGNLNIDKRAK